MREDEEKPPRILPQLKSVPKIRELFWCDFPRDAQLPELWKRRPVIILSKNAILSGTVTVIPCSTQKEQDPRFAFPLRTTIDEREAWAICDKPTTFAVSRLTSPRGGIVRMPADEFNEMLRIVLGLLPTPHPR